MEKEFKCKKCGFESNDAIDFMKAVHMNLPDILCNDCAKGKRKEEFDLSEKRICRYCKKALRKSNWGMNDYPISDIHDICAKREIMDELAGEKIR